MKMKDDYDVASLYVKRVPFYQGSEQAAMMCFESYKKHVVSVNNVNKIVPWDDCETVHDKRCKDELMRVSCYRNSHGEIALITMHAAMLAYVSMELPFTVQGDHKVVLTGKYLCDKFLSYLTMKDKMLETNVVDSTEKIDDERVAGNLLYYAMNNGERWHKIKEMIDHSYSHTPKLREYEDRGANVTMTQRVAMTWYDMTHDDFEISGFIDGAIMILWAKMLIGIEPDGYTHS